MPETIQDAAYAIILVFPIMSTLVVGLRCWARALTRQFGWDDSLIVVAWLLAVGQTVTIWIYTRLTYQGYHIYDIPPQSIEQKVTGQKYNLANQLLYNPILAIVKASIIIFLFRLQDHRPVVRWNLWALTAVNLALLIAIFLADLFQCTPLRYVFEAPAMDLAAQNAAGADKHGIKDGLAITGGKCFNQIAFFLGSAGLTIVTDVWLLLIPCIIVWRLQMSRRKKVAILCVLCLGVIVTALSIARLAIYAQRFRPGNPDPTYNIGHTVSGVEVNLAIVTASATALNSLLTRFAPGVWGYSAQYAGASNLASEWRGRSTTTASGVRPSRPRDMYPLKDGFRRQKQASDSQEEIMVYDGRSNISHVSATSSGPRAVVQS
ncbi:uncharacterized protein LDX57_002827 [Aspergillus melleus]|uniref:uncharacterized protein n=1 Tax=Aspergillus melleus TaxID=138277 RepID=UPI001E8E90DB|nr:uncharacterized protein LDX57_002827 [Aspergillus melleus]KAH8425079.1 hypothetical protein LDX57_002827 [Aspergillus melleus]